MKKIMTFILTIGILFCITGCGSDTKDVSNEKKASGEAGPNVSEELVLCCSQEPDGLDTYVYPVAVTRELTRPIFEGLFDLDENYNPKPQLCESYKAEEDNTLWTFKLREGVMFHNGKEMTADDAVASLNRWLDVSSSTCISYVGDARFEKVDTYTIKIQLDQPVAIMDYVLSDNGCYPYITTKEASESATDSGLTEFVGTGPYMFEEYLPSNYVKYKRYEDYQGPGYEMTGNAGDRNAYFENLTYKIVTDSAIRTSGAMSGEYDVTAGISYDDAAMFEDGDYTVEKHLVGMTSVTFNKSEGQLLRDDNIRKAAYFALNPTEIMNAVTPIEGFSEVYGSYMKKGNDFYVDVDSENWGQNVEKAKEYLAESSYDNTPIRMITTQMFPNIYNASLLAKEELEAVGFTVDLQVYDWPTMLSHALSKTDYDLYVMWGGTASVPTTVQFLNTDSDGYMKLPEITEMKEQLVKATDRDEMLSLWKEMQEMLNEDANALICGYAYDPYVISNDMKNVSVFQGIVPWGCYKE